MPKFLIIDDEAPIRISIRDILEYEKYDVDDAPDGIAGLELVKKNFPEDAKVEFVIEREFDKRLMVNTEGFELIKEPLLTMKNFPDKYYQILAEDIPYVRYMMTGERAVLNKIVSPKGMPIPAKVIIKIPGKAEYNPEMYLIINTIDRKGEAAGGLTLKIHKKRGDWKKN